MLQNDSRDSQPKTPIIIFALYDKGVDQKESLYYVTFKNSDDKNSDHAFLMRIKSFNLEKTKWQVIYEGFDQKELGNFNIENDKIKKRNSNKPANDNYEIYRTFFAEEVSDIGSSPYGKCVAAHINAMTSGLTAGAVLGIVCLAAGPECALVIASKCAAEVLFTNRWN